MSVHQEHSISLDARQLKWIAAILMTLDHISHIFSPSYGKYLTILGRVSAPVFVFLLVQSFFHTHNQKKMLLRLYLGSLLMGIVNVILSRCFHTSGNSNQMIVLTNIFLILCICETYKSSPQKRICYGILYSLTQILFPVLLLLLGDYIPYDIIPLLAAVFSNIFVYNSFGLFFLFIGIVFYHFHHRKYVSSILYAFMSLSLFFWINQGGLCYITNEISRFLKAFSPIAAHIFQAVILLQDLPVYVTTSSIFHYQWLMVFAVPLFLLYEDRKVVYGKYKYAFYFYYPVHILVLYFIRSI